MGRRSAPLSSNVSGPPYGWLVESFVESSVLDESLELDMGMPVRVDAATRPSDEMLLKLKEVLLKAKHPAILAGHELATRATACVQAHATSGLARIEKAGHGASTCRQPIVPCRYRRSVPWDDRMQRRGDWTA